MSLSTIPRLQVFAAALLFSTGGAAIKACTLTGWQVASLRSGVAAAALVILIPAARRGWNRRTLLVAVAYAATMICFVLGNKMTTAANTIFLQATAPIYVLLLSPWVLKEKARLREVGIMIVMALGMTLFFIGAEPPTASAPNPMGGNLAGLGAGFFYGLMLLGLRRLNRRDSLNSNSEGDAAAGTAISAVAMGNLLAFVVAFPFAWPIETFSTADLVSISYLGVVQIALAYLLLTTSMKRLPALEASLLLMAEPVLNPVWAWVFQGELPGLWARIGGAVILLATLALTLLRNREPPASAHPG